MTEPNDRIEATDARAAEKTGHVRWMLAGGTAAVAILLFGVFAYFAL
ncbi:MAG: hypothetical protein RIM80_01685 [Alphaproteobacteria bacterium]